MTTLDKNAAVAGEIIKLNKSGGLYIKHPSFFAWSKKNNKFYAAGMNVDMNVIKALLSDKGLCERVLNTVAGIEAAAKAKAVEGAKETTTEPVTA